MPPAPRHDPAEAPATATLVLTDTPEHYEGDPVQPWDWVDCQEAPSGLQPKEN